MNETLAYPNTGVLSPIVNTTTVFYTNEAGSLGYSHYWSAYGGVDDALYFNIHLNPAITNNYTKVIVVGNPGFDNYTQSNAIYSAQATIETGNSFNNPAGTGGLTLRIYYYGDNLNNIKPSGTYMIYGIK